MRLLCTNVCLYNNNRHLLLSRLNHTRQHNGRETFETSTKEPLKSNSSAFMVFKIIMTKHFSRIWTNN